MNPDQQQAILTLALLAAFADGANDDREREQIRQLAETLGGEAGANELPRIYQQVLLKKVNLNASAAILVEPEHRQLAYEMAACVCDADGRMTEVERKFLLELGVALGLDNRVTARANNQAEAMAELADDAAPATVAVRTLGPVVSATPTLPDAEMDKSILNYAILNGDLEIVRNWLV